MDNIASQLDLDPISVRLANLNPEFLSDIPPMIDDLKENSDLINRQKTIQEFNNVRVD